MKQHTFGSCPECTNLFVVGLIGETISPRKKAKWSRPTSFDPHTRSRRTEATPDSSIDCGSPVDTARLSSGTGTTMQIGSSFSNFTRLPGRVNRQFIVNGNGSQSVSTMPSKAMMPSFGVFAGPRTTRSTPSGVRNRYGRDQVTTPYPNMLLTSGGLDPTFVRNLIASGWFEPVQATSKSATFKIHQPF